MNFIHVLSAGLLISLTSLSCTKAVHAQPDPGGRPPPAAPRVPDGVKLLRDIPYVANGHPRQKLDLYLPEKADGPLPLIIWVHGGGWQAGSKDGCPPARDNYMARGYAVASIGYRLSGDAIFPAQIEDCKAAIRWLRAHAKEHNLNPDRFAAWGSSAGGHLVALLGTSGDVKAFDVGAHLDQSSRVQAVCDYYGPTDLLQMDAHAFNKERSNHNAANSPESRLIGGAIQENKEKVAKANPITYVSKDDPPFLIVHGDQDPTVAHHQSQLLYDALKDAGVRVRFHTIEGAGHGTGFGGPELESLVQGFFDRHLKDAKTPAEEAVASTTRSKAFVRAGSPNQPAANPGGNPGANPGVNPATRPAAGGRTGVTWDMVRTREDANNDGKVTRDEFKGPPPMFDRLDRNRDGSLTKDDFGEAGVPPRAPADNAPAATNPAEKPGADVKPGFQLTGDKWTYKDGDFVMTGILLKPEGNGPFPAVLISHGLGGSAESFGMTKAREMVKWGVVCIAPNYTHNVGRGGARPGGGAPAANNFGASAENIRRAKTCLDLLAKMPEVDSKRIAAYGHSMGGFVTIGLAASSPELLKAAAITGSGVAPRDGYPAPSVDAADKVRTPFLILHGSADNVVRPEQSASFQETLNKNKVTNQRKVFDGEGHPIDQSKRDEVFANIREWFTRQGVTK